MLDIMGIDPKELHSEREAFDTPAFIYDERAILDVLSTLARIRLTTHCELLFPLKSFTVADALYHMAPHIDGFSASSVFEAKLARELLGNQKTVHMTTPGLRDYDIPIISELCNYVSFNSISQWKRYYEKVSSKVSCGLRINPQLAFVEDERYNPCRRGSKLGAPLSQLAYILENGGKSITSLRGIHFHTNCESTNFGNLLTTVRHIDVYLATLLKQVDWVNLGGGYLFQEAKNLDRFVEAVVFLRNKYGVKIFFEPGKGIVGRAGYILSSVLDMFQSDGHIIVVLDTSVNHAPEVFEYQCRPEVLQESKDGEYVYTLAGATCLAGDLFGEYAFDEPLEIGSRIVFENMGAYTLVKAHMFNGVNLPTIYAYTEDGKLELKKQFKYEDFRSRWG